MNTNPDIKLACMSLMWRGLEEPDRWRVWLDDVQAAGYEGAALFDSELLEWAADAALEAELEARGLALASVDFRISRDFERLRAVCEIMQRLGAEHLVTLGGLARRLTDVDEIADVLNEIGGIALEYGVRAGFHNHTGDYGETLEQTEELNGCTDPARFFGFLDIGHATKDFTGHPIAERAAIYLQRNWEGIDFLEFKDWSAETDLCTTVGAGECNYDAVFAILKERAYCGWITVEQNGPTGDMTRRDCARASREFIERRLAR